MGGPAVLVYAPPRFVKEGVDKKRARYPSAKLDAEALKKFIFKRSVPLVGQKTWKSGVPVVTLFAAIDLEKNAKGFDYFANRLRKVAADYVGKLSFNIGDKEDFSYQLEDYGIELPAKKDVGVGAKDGNKYYRMEDKFNVDNVRKFAQAVVDGALEPKIKEEPSYDDDHDASGEADDSDYEESDVTVLTDPTSPTRPTARTRCSSSTRPGAATARRSSRPTRSSGRDGEQPAGRLRRPGLPDAHLQDGLGQDDVLRRRPRRRLDGGVHQGARGGRVREVGALGTRRRPGFNTFSL